VRIELTKSLIFQNTVSPETRKAPVSESRWCLLYDTLVGVVRKTERGAAFYIYLGVCLSQFPRSARISRLGVSAGIQVTKSSICGDDHFDWIIFHSGHVWMHRDWTAIHRAVRTRLLYEKFCGRFSSLEFVSPCIPKTRLLWSSFQRGRTDRWKNGINEAV